MIKVICVGKIKEAYLSDAIKDYKRRLSRYIKLEIIEVNDIDSNNTNIILSKEKELIERFIDTKDYIIALDIEGSELSSIELANKIDSIFNIKPNITFIIGGSCGLHDEIKRISDYRLSFSKLTFPHQLFRLMLLEQLYRSFKINKNEAYHK